MARDFETQGNNNGARPPIVYKDLGVFTGEDDWAVRVQTNDGGRPRYSYEFGKMRDGKFLRFVAAGVETFDGSVNVPELDMVALATVMPKCYAAVREDAQRREDEFQARRGSRPGGGGGGYQDRRGGRDDRGGGDDRGRGRGGKGGGRHRRRDDDRAGW